MKNVIKRVSAFVMAFTILGAGSAITQSFLPQLGNSIVASAATYHIDTAGINFIKQHEGLRLVAYKVQESDPYYTIGFGHYGPDVYAGMVITEAEAVELLKNDLVKYEQKVQKQTTGLAMSQAQYNALISLCYNTGGGNSIISNSPLVKFLKEEYSEKTAREKYASYYVTSNGKKLKGLVNRRNAEADYFFSQNVSDLPFIDVNQAIGSQRQLNSFITMES